MGLLRVLGLFSYVRPIVFYLLNIYIHETSLFWENNIIQKSESLLDNHSDSFLALDLDFGKIKWYHQLGGYDVWFVACNNLSTPNCPPSPNPDADFGEAPMMVSINSNNTKLDIVFAVQKSGFAWALDHNNGNLIWSTISWLDILNASSLLFIFSCRNP